MTTTELMELIEHLSRERTGTYAQAVMAVFDLLDQRLRKDIFPELDPEVEEGEEEQCCCCGESFPVDPENQWAVACGPCLASIKAGREQLRREKKEQTSMSNNNETDSETEARWNAYRRAAKRLFHEDGTLEIDGTATVSEGSDDGAYVQAWVWVSDINIRPEDSNS
jgi:hypothetical protein